MRIAAAPLLASLLAVLPSCGDETPAPDDAELSVRVLPGAGTAAEPIKPGRAFPLTVVRAWGAAVEPEPFEQRSLAPLVLRFVGSERRESGPRTEESLHYQAYAFALDDVRVPATVLHARPRDGGPPRKALSQRFVLRVHPDVDPAAPGPPEVPDAPLEPPAARTPWSAAAAALFALLLAVTLWLRRRTHPPAPREVPAPADAPRLSPAEQALGALADLAAASRSPADTLERVADVVRTFVAESLGVPAPRLTSTEAVAGVAARTDLVPPDALDLLRAVLGRADLVKFAGRTPDLEEREAMLADARRFVERTSARQVRA